MKNQRLFRLIALYWMLIGFSTSINCNADHKINAFRGAYLWKFSNLITWPADTRYPNNQFVLCAATEDKKDIFQLSTLKEGVGGRALKVKHLDQYPNEMLVSSCHLLFISKNIENKYKEVISKPPKHTVVVTEGKYVLSGDIYLFILGHNLKFDIKNKSLIERGFKMGSKLLYLSRTPK